ncbi:MAG: GNAT family N-acetyltransferase [Anaerotardibacter sp.]
MSSELKIRLATPEDAAAIRDIYAPYVLETAVTFEITPPTVEEMRERIVEKTVSYPYLVAEDENGKIFGFSYASAFRPRAAYIHSVESSIYCRKDFKGKGLGRRLYEALFKLLEAQNIFNVLACVAYVEPEDEYVPKTSKIFHEKLGFKQIACFSKCGHKFGNWYDMIWLERFLKEHVDNPDPFIPLPELDPEIINAVLENA